MLAMVSMKDIARELLPPLLWRCISRLAHGRREPEPRPPTVECGWFGDYSSWAEVAALASGYDASQILANVELAALKAKRGECVFERDASCQFKQFYNWPLLASLFHCACQTGGRLRVLDFGGSLGSTYMQYRTEWGALLSVEWSVVEQPHYVLSGKKHIEDQTIRFFETVDLAMAERDFDILLLSSVIDYVEKPYELLYSLHNRGFRWVILDRTGFSLEGRDRLSLQKVPPSIYDASYPCWFLDQQKVCATFSGYRVVWDFISFDETECNWPRPPSRFMGMLLARENP